MPEGLDGKPVGPDDSTKTVRARDGCVVDSAPLAGLLLPFIDRWTQSRPATAGRFATGGNREQQPVTATGWLSAETGVSERTIQNIVKRDKDTGESKPLARTTELRIADALVAAVGRPEAFYDGTLEVRENPLADAQSRAACCKAIKP